MSSLKIETPRAPQQPRTSEQKATPATPSKGIVPSAPKAPKGDGFEKTRLPGRRGGGSTYEPSGTGGPKATLMSIGASGTKPQPTELSQAVRDQLDRSAVDIVARLPDLTQGQFRQAVNSAVDSLNLEFRSQKRLARHYLLNQISRLTSSGSGASGTKPLGAELMAARPPDSGSILTSGTHSAPGTDLSKAVAPHRPALTDVARKLASDPNLRTDAQVRKAAWAELKKLGLGEAASQEARSFVLDQLATLRRRSR